MSRGNIHVCVFNVDVSLLGLCVVQYRVENVVCM